MGCLLWCREKCEFSLFTRNQGSFRSRARGLVGGVLVFEVKLLELIDMKVGVPSISLVQELEDGYVWVFIRM